VGKLCKFAALLVMVNFAAFAASIVAPGTIRPAEALAAAPSAQPATHPLDGTWEPDLAASAKFFKFPESLKKDLAGLRVTLLTKTGSMALDWSDGAKGRKTFRIVSFSGRLYRVVVDNRNFTINTAQKDVLVFTEQDAYGNNNVIIFRRLK
jgi:hypothetical protein